MTEIEAVYHAGRLELKSPLPPADGQPVRVAEIQSVSGAMDEAEIASDVAEAVSQVRQHKGG